MLTATRLLRLATLAALSLAGRSGAAELTIDLSGHDPACGVEVVFETETRLRARWPIEGGETGEVALDFRPGRALVERMAIVRDGRAVPLLRSVEPVTYLTVGSRVGESSRPPDRGPFATFFDNPHTRPHRTFRSRLSPRRVTVNARGRRASIVVDGLEAGPFSGTLEWTFYPGSRLVQVEAVLTTRDDLVAFTYDTGLIATDGAPGFERVAWVDTEGTTRRAAVDPEAVDRPVAVRHRLVAAEGANGSVACLPPPHQFFFPRDWTDNLETAWFGRNHRGLGDGFGFGVRQPETGGGNYVPWFNAPPGTAQRLGVFYLLTPGDAEAATREALRYTHGDRFPELPGHVTFTSHYHMAMTMAALAEVASGRPRTTPDFVTMFKDMGVSLVHLGEFHGDGHQYDPGPLRLPELEAMFEECRRLSDPDLLLIPGEEISGILGLPAPGRHPGHWMSLFPRPVLFAMKRAEGQPFAEPHPRYGTLYRVGGRDDMLRLLRAEGGLAWTAHPRIKASQWTPDIFKDEDFYRDATWLGAAWKAMPADLSRPALGERGLDLLSDMANWGGPKYMPGEVDVFKLDHTHELYAHMNVNYLRLDRVPRFDEGWQPVLDALRGGRFFVTTGEILIRDFRVGGVPSGGTLKSGTGPGPEVRLTLDWTFPLRFVEVVSGDGRRVFRDRVELPDTAAFGSREFTLTPDLAGRTWVRVEAWDVAADGAFTQPVWIEPR